FRCLGQQGGGMSMMWSKMGRIRGRKPGVLPRDPVANALGIFAAALLLAISASVAFALSESPAAGSSPSASAAPAPSEAGAAGATGTTTKRPRTHHKATPPEVEPATARLRVIQD